MLLEWYFFQPDAIPVIHPTVCEKLQHYQ